MRPPPGAWKCSSKRGIETLSQMTWTAYVSALNTVTIRSCVTGGSAMHPRVQTWRADVWQH